MYISFKTSLGLPQRREFLTSLWRERGVHGGAVRAAAGGESAAGPHAVQGAAHGTAAAVAP